MKTLWVLGIVIWCAGGSLPAAEKAPGPEKVPVATAKLTAEQVATTYFESLVSGNIAKANELSTVPFSFDRKMELAKKTELEAKHQEILANKGKRAVPKYTSAIVKDAVALDPKIFPKYTVIRCSLDGRKNGIDIYVTAEGEPKVIGFSD